MTNEMMNEAIARGAAGAVFAASDIDELTFANEVNLK